MTDFDDELARRRAELQDQERTNADKTQQEEEAFLEAASAFATELTATFKTERLRFSISDRESDEDDTASAGELNPYLIAIWCRDVDDTIAFVSLGKDYHGLLLNYEIDAAEFFNETWSSDRGTFVDALRTELIDGLAKYLDAQET